MNCPNCGTELGENDTYCPSCGTSVSAPQKPAQQTAVQPTEKNTLAIAGFILAFFAPLIGLILSAIGLKRCKMGYDHKGLAIAGVVISAVSMLIYLIIFIVYIGAIMAILGAGGAF